MGIIGGCVPTNASGWESFASPSSHGQAEVAQPEHFVYVKETINILLCAQPSIDFDGRRRH